MNILKSDFYRTFLFHVIVTPRYRKLLIKGPLAFVNILYRDLLARGYISVSIHFTITLFYIFSNKREFCNSLEKQTTKDV